MGCPRTTSTDAPQLCNRRAATRAPPPSARQHDNAPAERVAVEKTETREVREIASRVLHHLYQLDREIFDHRTIDFHHLTRRQIRHVERDGLDVHERSPDPSLEPLLEVMPYPQGIRHDRQRGIHGSARDEEATVDDVEIVHIVRLAINVER